MNLSVSILKPLHLKKLIRAFVLILAIYLNASLLHAVETEDSSATYTKILVTPSRIRQGQSFTVFIDSSSPIRSIELTGFNRTLPLYRIWHKSSKYLYRSFIGVPATQKPGDYPIVAEVLGTDEMQQKIISMLRVDEGNYKIQRIHLPKKKIGLLDVEQLKKEGHLLGSRLRIQSPKVFFASDFVRPSRGRLSSRFGSRRQYNDEEFSSYHKGLDIANKEGTAVKAANGGKISLAASLKSNGKVILINHGHGIISIYSHLSVLGVREGQWVKKGQVIGKIGTTGISSGPHLHFGISVNNVRVDPEQWLKSEVVLYYNPQPQSNEQEDAQER